MRSQYTILKALSEIHFLIERVHANPVKSILPQMYPAEGNC